jgi:hypothetical protein
MHTQNRLSTLKYQFFYAAQHFGIELQGRGGKLQSHAVVNEPCSANRCVIHGDD